MTLIGSLAKSCDIAWMQAKKADKPKAVPGFIVAASVSGEPVIDVQPAVLVVDTCVLVAANNSKIIRIAQRFAR